MNKDLLSTRIKAARIEKGYTQSELARLAGISNVYLSEIERGMKMPSLNSFIKIVQALGVSADDILRDELPSGDRYIYDELTIKLKDLTPQQRKTVVDILDGYLRNI